MLYGDEKKGIYSELFKLPNFNLPLTNDIVTIDFLDKKFMYQNSQKEINLGLEDLDVAAKILVAKYYDKWLTYINAVNNKNLPVGETTTTTQTGIINNTTSAMDSDELINTDGQNNKNTIETTVINADNTSKMLNLYQKFSVYDMIDTDIRRLLFVNVY